MELALDKELLDILACPQCKGKLTRNKKGDGLVCGGCDLVYPIKDGIPVLIVDEAVRSAKSGK